MHCDDGTVRVPRGRILFRDGNRRRVLALLQDHGALRGASRGASEAAFEKVDTDVGAAPIIGQINRGAVGTAGEIGGRRWSAVSCRWPPPPRRSSPASSGIEPRWQKRCTARGPYEQVADDRPRTGRERPREMIEMGTNRRRRRASRGCGQGKGER